MVLNTMQGLKHENMNTTMTMGIALEHSRVSRALFKFGVVVSTVSALLDERLARSECGSPLNNSKPSTAPSTIIELLQHAQSP